jgi:hypothetical protein
MVRRACSYWLFYATPENVPRERGCSYGYIACLLLGVNAQTCTLICDHDDEDLQRAARIASMSDLPNDPLFEALSEGRSFGDIEEIVR